MEDIKLSLSQAGPAGELSIIRVDGVVDTITASELENVIEKLLAQKRYRILIDLGGVEYISSAGWGIFVSKIQEIRDHAGDIKLVNMIPNVYEIYELLEFEHIIQAFDSLDYGKKAFNISGGGEATGERVWKTNDKVITEPGSSFQTALSPGTKYNRESSPASGRAGGHKVASVEEVILGLVIEDPFSSIGELVEQANEMNLSSRVRWWQVFGILRRNGLLRHRSRFRYTRRHNKR